MGEVLNVSMMISGKTSYKTSRLLKWLFRNDSFLSWEAELSLLIQKNGVRNPQLPLRWLALLPKHYLC